MEIDNNVDALVERLKKIKHDYSDVVFANSFGAEDMVLTDLIGQHVPDIEVVSLDTGRLHEETYKLIDTVRQRYGIGIKIYYPDTTRLQDWIGLHGVNAFYVSTDLRKSCCEIRKVEPLTRALRGKQAWITGLRQQQAKTRAVLQEKEWDENFSLHKFNPLLEWNEKQVWHYLKTNNVPYNRLHDSGYASIGCAPCTRAISVGDDIRAGRWWWEAPESKECGLHVKKEFA